MATLTPVGKAHFLSGVFCAVCIGLLRASTCAHSRIMTFAVCRLCTEVGLLDSSFTTRGADIVYARVKDRFARKIGYLGFLDALSLVATKKEIGVGEVVLEVRTCEMPAVQI
jgi:hypothetical protein